MKNKALCVLKTKKILMKHFIASITIFGEYDDHSYLLIKTKLVTKKKQTFRYKIWLAREFRLYNGFKYAIEVHYTVRILGLMMWYVFYTGYRYNKLVNLIII